MRIDPDYTLFDITERWPQTLEILTSHGFPQLGNPAMRETFGREVTLRQALALKQIDEGAFLALLDDVVEGEPEAAVAADTLRVAGLLPCPVRIPLQEAFDEFLAAYRQETGVAVEHDLQAASVGASWLDEHICGVEDPRELPDLFVSAGFEMFFDPKGIGRFRDEFFDGLPYDRFNAAFDGVDLADPDRRYSIISVVPTVFLVNTRELGDLPMPRTWEDLFEPRFEQRISLPVGDFDLFSAMLLDIHRRFGDEGLEKLAAGFQMAQHPAQMVKAGSGPQPPIVTIMPYFFTRMARIGGLMKAVWPEDGAIVSPIFLLAKKEKREKLQPLIDFFGSAPLGELLAHKGLFPSTHPDVDNQLEEGARFLWLGWDYIRSNDISALIEHCAGVFHGNANS